MVLQREVGVQGYSLKSRISTQSWTNSVHDYTILKRLIKFVFKICYVFSTSTIYIVQGLNMYMSVSMYMFVSVYMSNNYEHCTSMLSGSN